MHIMMWDVGTPYSLLPIYCHHTATTNDQHVGFLKHLAISVAVGPRANKVRTMHRLQRDEAFYNHLEINHDKGPQLVMRVAVGYYGGQLEVPDSLECSWSVVSPCYDGQYLITDHRL